MLQQILEELGHGANVMGEHAQPYATFSEHLVQASDMADATASPNAILPSDTGAQWSAGLLYAWSGQTVDKRDYILQCTNDSPYVNRELGSAFSDYSSGEYWKGNKHMAAIQPAWQSSMIWCFATNQYFDQIRQETTLFFWQPDWHAQALKNYAANKKYIDEQWTNALKTWNEGVYFNAGMFYGRTLLALGAANGL